ncbi:hypothetical protein PPYR_07585, partial [Photinus pyralis]
RFSSWTKLLRTTAIVLRFLKRLPGRGQLTAVDLETAENVLLQIVQKRHFINDIRLLENTGTCSAALVKYRPFLRDGLLRVGGRLENSQLSFDSQHPILLPKRDHLVNLLIEYYHHRGSNFVGAKSQLKDLFELIRSENFKTQIEAELTIKGIQWNFIAPGAPHMGGLWESNIKSVKSHLLKIVGDQLLTYEELNTLLIQIECLLNSRPLCVLSSDPAEPIALTPAHFLTLTPLDRLPAINVMDVNLSRLSRYQLIDHMVQHFWQRWRIEYLHTMQTREKLGSRFSSTLILHTPNPYRNQNANAVTQVTTPTEVRRATDGQTYAYRASHRAVTETEKECTVLDIERDIGHLQPYSAYNCTTYAVLRLSEIYH